MHNIKRYLSGFIILLMLILFTSCSKDEELVDEIFKDLLTSFQEEGMARNIIVDYQNKPVEVRFENHPDDIRLGWCIHDFDGYNTITINALFWDIMKELDKEKLVFHELGHCVLNRPHLDRIRPDGFCYSIMHSGQACSDNYSLETREAYIDELFLR